jgi:hypothetical protein
MSVLHKISVIVCCFIVIRPGILFAQQQAFTTIGINNFTVPASVIEITAEAIGGGGGGGLVRGSSERESGGGGGGAYAKGKVTVIPGADYIVGVGNFGKKERDDIDARHGGDSYFNSDTSIDASTTVRAQGGQTLLHNDNSDITGKPGGQAGASVGNVATWSGGMGGSTNSNNYGGGGGAAAGSTGDGGAGGQYIAGVRGAGNLLNGDVPGDGGLGGIDSGDDTGTPGNLYGGGGGGARKSLSGSSSTRNGEPGAQGIVVLTWSEVTAISSATLCAGDFVTVTGSNFINVSEVSFNGIPAGYNTLDSANIETVLPVGATSGDVVISTEYGKAKIAYTVINASTWYADADTDGFGNAAISTVSCSQPLGYIADSTDCDDNNSALNVTCTTTGASPHKNADAMFALYPNPSSGIIWIENVADEKFNIEVFDITGKQVESGRMNITSSEAKLMIDLSSLRASVYMVKLTGANGAVAKRVLKY